VARRIRPKEALEVFAGLMAKYGIVEHICSSNGPEMVAEQLRNWLAHMGSKMVHIAPGSSRENGYCESLTDWLRDAPLNGEIFFTLIEAQDVSEHWKKHRATGRPHSVLDRRPSAPAVALPMEKKSTIASGKMAARTNPAAGPANPHR
jgi:hypothetical protein